MIQDGIFTVIAVKKYSYNFIYAFFCVAWWVRFNLDIFEKFGLVIQVSNNSFRPLLLC